VVVKLVGAIGMDADCHIEFFAGIRQLDSAATMLEVDAWIYDQAYTGRARLRHHRIAISIKLIQI
jgi:hypothetical protein